MTIASDIFTVSIGIFERTAGFTNMLVVPLALTRIVFANVSGGGSREVSDVFKGVVLYFCLIYSFEPILKILTDLPEAFGFRQMLLPDKLGNEKANVLNSMSLMPWALSVSLETLASIFYYTAVFLNFTFTVLLTAIAPVIFLMGSVLGIGFGLKAFFGLLVLVGSWPIIWASCDAVYGLIGSVSSSSFGLLVFEIVILLIKISAPLALGFFGAMSSPIGRAAGLVGGGALGSALLISRAGINTTAGTPRALVHGYYFMKNEPREMTKKAFSDGKKAVADGVRKRLLPKRILNEMAKAQGQSRPIPKPKAQDENGSGEK